MQAELVTRLAAFVHSVVPAELEQLPLGERCSIDAIEALARALSRWVLEQVLEAWKNALERGALGVGRECPGCGHERKCKTRPGHPMRLELLGVELAVRSARERARVTVTERAPTGRCDSLGAGLLLPPLRRRETFVHA